MNDDMKFILFCAFILGISFGGFIENQIVDKNYILAIPALIVLTIIVLRWDYIIAKLGKIFSSQESVKT